MDLFFTLQCYGAAFCGNVNSVDSVYVQAAMENYRNPDRCADPLDLASPERITAASRPYPIIFSEAAAASNEANLGISCKMALPVFQPALSQRLGREIV